MLKKSASERFWTLSCWKSARGCGAKKISKSRCKNASQHFWKLRCSKSARCCGAKHIWKSNVLKTEGLGLLFEVRMWFGVAGARDSAPCQKWVKREGFVAILKAMAGVGRLNRIWKDTCRLGRLAGVIEEIFPSEMLGGHEGDFLQGAAFWSIRSSGLLRWCCVTGAALPMSWPHFFAGGAVL